MYLAIKIDKYPNPISYQGKFYLRSGSNNHEVNLKNDLYAKHYSTPFNPKIAQVFFKAGFTESWGRGFTKIKEACQNYECPLPELYMDKGGTMILCKASERYMKLLNNISLSNDTINDTIKLTKNEQKILNLIIENNQITREEIVSKTGLSDRTVSRAIKNLQNNNLILREGSKKLGSWKIL